MNQHLKLADLEIPKDLWSLSDDERKDITLSVKIFLERIVNRQLGIKVNKKFFMIKLLESTMILNEAEENYEICQVIKEIKEMIE
jgi:hypothetical protein